MRATVLFDNDSDGVYINLENGRDNIARSPQIENAMVFVDLDEDGVLVGIEIIGIADPYAWVGVGEEVEEG